MYTLYDQMHLQQQQQQQQYFLKSLTLCFGIGLYTSTLFLYFPTGYRRIPIAADQNVRRRTPTQTTDAIGAGIGDIAIILIDRFHWHTSRRA